MQLEVDGHQTYAATGGRPFDPAKPAAIFIHGAGMDHSYWQLQSRWFAWHGWSVLAVDLPGHGRSDGEPLTSIAGISAWIGRFMDAAGVDPEESVTGPPEDLNPSAWSNTRAGTSSIYGRP